MKGDLSSLVFLFFISEKENPVNTPFYLNEKTQGSKLSEPARHYH